METNNNSMSLEEQIATVTKIMELVKTFNATSGKRIELEGRSDEMMQRLEKEQLFGFDLGYASRNVHDIEHIYFFGPDSSIGVEDNDKKPANEYLYTISFTTGPYTFTDAFYAKSLFDEFFNELKSFNPKFSDTCNSSLYFRPDNAKAAHDALPLLLKRYGARVSDEYRKYKIASLTSEIAKLSEVK